MVFDNEIELSLNNLFSPKGFFFLYKYFFFQNELSFWQIKLHIADHKVYKVNVKTMRKIVQIFVAFSEKLNFNITFL